MLHLNVERADLVCAKHSHDSHPHAVDGQSAHDAHSVATHADHGTASQSESCETPVQQDCCQALVTCSIALGLDDAGSAARPAAFHDGVLALAQSEPTSRVTAPEPPPPRA